MKHHKISGIYFSVKPPLFELPLTHFGKLWSNTKYIWIYAAAKYLCELYFLFVINYRYKCEWHVELMEINPSLIYYSQRDRNTLCFIIYSSISYMNLYILFNMFIFNLKILLFYSNKIILLKIIHVYNIFVRYILCIILKNFMHFLFISFIKNSNKDKKFSNESWSVSWY